MSKILDLTLAGALAACAAPTSASTQQPQNPPGPKARSVNGAVPQDPGKAGFTFLAGGHLYGNPGALSAIPAATLVAQIHALRNSQDKFIVSSGDFIRSFDPAMVAPTNELLRFIDKPLFNAPGNHDYVAGKYEKAFGPSYGSFVYGNALFVILNTERKPWHFEQAQLDMIESTAGWVQQQANIDHVFYFAHKVVFAVGEPRYAAVLKNCNGRDGFDGTCNFRDKVLPTVRKVAQQKRVLWFCGDLGVSWGFSLFYDEHPTDKITYLGCGLGATESDCMLRISVTGRSLRVDPIPMHAGATIKNGLRIDKGAAHYGPDFWNAHFAKKAKRQLPKPATGK